MIEVGNVVKLKDGINLNDWDHEFVSIFSKKKFIVKSMNKFNIIVFTPKTKIKNRFTECGVITISKRYLEKTSFIKLPEELFKM